MAITKTNTWPMRVARIPAPHHSPCHQIVLSLIQYELLGHVNMWMYPYIAMWICNGVINDPHILLCTYDTFYWRLPPDGAVEGSGPRAHARRIPGAATRQHAKSDLIYMRRCWCQHDVARW